MKVLSVACLLLTATHLASGNENDSRLKNGVYKSPTGQCSVTLSGNAMGGHKLLQLPTSAQMQDVSGLDWLTDSKLVYSVSPIYGQPGIYVYDCVRQKNRRIVAPRNIGGY